MNYTFYTDSRNNYDKTVVNFLFLLDKSYTHIYYYAFDALLKQACLVS